MGSDPDDPKCNDSTEPPATALVAQASLLSEAYTETISRIVAYVAQHYRASIACAALESHQGLHLKARIGIERDFVALPSILQHKVRRSLPIIIKDASSDMRFGRDMLVQSEPFIRFYAGAPIMCSATNWIGTLCIADPESRFLSLNDTDVLVKASRNIMRIYEAARESHPDADLWEMSVDGGFDELEKPCRSETTASGSETSDSQADPDL